MVCSSLGSRLRKAGRTEGDLQLFSFAPKTFDNLTGKGRTFFKETNGLLDLSGTYFINSKSGSVVLFQAGLY